MPEIEMQEVAASCSNLSKFFNHVYPLSFIDFDFVAGNHFDVWANMLQNSQNTCILAPRKHGKSVNIYAYLDWEHLRNVNRNLEILYLSFSQKMATYHVNKYKQTIFNNPMFKSFVDLTGGSATSAKWKINGKIHRVEAEGILSFKRGRHPDIIVLDDVLADPTTLLEPAVIRKINDRVQGEVMSMPKEGGKVKIVGTAQTPIDFFFELKKHPKFSWGMFPAIIDWKKEITLWPEQFNFKRLMEIRDHETGPKGFDREYMLNPVWSTESFFDPDHLRNHVINSQLRNVGEIRSKNEVGAGWDLGRKSHPSHFAVFEFVPIGDGIDIAYQRFQMFMDGWPFEKQVNYVKTLVEALRVDYVNWDNTREELQGFYERGDLDNQVFNPQVFTSKYKHRIATEFEKHIMARSKTTGGPMPTVQLIDDARQTRQILAVRNDLDAIETHEGHGDAFWSVAMALDRSKGIKIPFTLG